MATNRYLLDTHCLIWFQDDYSKIPGKILDLIADPKNSILFSQVSLFELAIKQKIGKLPGFSASMEDVYNQALRDSFSFLNIQNSHIYIYATIPLLENHRDPFDRLLIATAITEEAIILSADDKFKLYGDMIKVIW
ncbi:MAG TPA: type II toxin-antitoxin system VapC family toxin [Mucilaginibacter sp.]